MSTYQEYQKQLLELTKLAEEARKSELNQAKEKIHAILSEHGLTIADLGLEKPFKNPKVQVAAKYRNTTTGETWSGRGRPPLWLEGQDKNDYLIKA